MNTIGYSPGLELAVIPVIIINILINLALPLLYNPLYKKYKSRKVFFIVLSIIVLSNCIYILDNSKAQMSMEYDTRENSHVKNNFHVLLKLTTVESDSTEGLITITKNNNLYKKIISKGNKYPLDLELNSFYSVTFEKKEYVSKRIYFDTRIPIGRDNIPFSKFNALVELHVGNPKTTLVAGTVNYDLKSKDFQKVEN